jgi:SAM-dependent MidA family methyltransferase
MEPASAPGGNEGGELGLPALGALPAASSLLSSRWSRDNLVTSHPGRLYDGKILEPIGLELLKELIRGLEAARGPLRPGACRFGVHTWEVSCADAEGPFTLSVPVALDELGTHGRKRSDVPRANVENLLHFRASGLTRYVGEPRGLIELGGGVPGALLPAFPEHYPVTFGSGSLRVELLETSQSFQLALGAAATAELLSELVAALAYHYDAGAGGGTAITDVCVNDGDFVVRRRADGSFDVRLTTVRRREGGIGPSLLLLYLVQLMAYEDWNVDGELIGLPVLISNPAVAFEGLVRGRRHRHRDLGLPEHAGEEEARRWIADFARAVEGRAYRPWVEHFLSGRLPLAFGADLRERWWRLIPLETKLGLLELRARLAADARAASSARAMKAFLSGLSGKIGVVPAAEQDVPRLNDLDHDAVLRALSEVGTTGEDAESAARALFASWPYRSWDHLMARAPAARALRRLKSRLSIGQIVAHADQGTLKSLAAPANEATEGREIANHEIFSYVPLGAARHAEAVTTFPTFEAFMDAALHHPVWGYYGHGVVIGSEGHFDTHPQMLSPHYGRWVASAAFEAFRILHARGELHGTSAFPIVELGAGNGRLARDFLDALPGLAAAAETPDRELFRLFAQNLSYRIYETSAALREKQRTMLGDRAVVVEGDARRPAEALARDFPNGLRGFVVTNEVPDAFGVHKVLVTREGRAFAVLVVPRAAPDLRSALPDPLPGRLAATDKRLRERFDLAGNPGDSYLDAETYDAVMVALAEEPAERRIALHAHLWFEETLVPAAHLPPLAAHLSDNARALAIAVAAEDSGVVLYLNVHADRFIREIGGALRAGFVVTIDYGDTTFGLVQGARRGQFPFRVYGDWRDYVPRPNDPYAAPGTQDLTADVSFTSLARAGEHAGLRVLHYGLERSVTGPELALALRSADQDAFAKFLGNPVFKVLVQGTLPGVLFPGADPPLPLFHGEEHVPKARRHRIADLERNLTGG